jgi:hypothetical protein
MDYVFCALIVGVGATAVMDFWGIVRKSLIGLPPPNYGLVGRWLAGVARGRFRNDSIATSPAVRFEGLIGWSAHYLIVGIGTVAAPFLLMQPGMGAGIAASRTPNPSAARLQSLITHAVFGLGLYGAGFVARFIYMQGLLRL